LLAVLPLIYFVEIVVQGYVHVPMMYEEDLFIRQNLFEGKPSQVSP
jgi:hypothetical protein